MPIYRNFADLTRLYLLGRNHQTLHTLCGMDEQFGQVSSIGMQPYVRRMIEYFIGDTRHAYLSLLEGRRLRAELVRIGSSFLSLELFDHVEKVTYDLRFVNVYLNEIPNACPKKEGRCKPVILSAAKDLGAEQIANHHRRSFASLRMTQGKYSPYFIKLHHLQVCREKGYCCVRVCAQYSSRSLLVTMPSNWSLFMTATADCPELKSV